MSWDAIEGFRLVTTDLDRSSAFYQALGFRLQARTPIPRGEMALLGIAGEGLRQPMMLGPSRVDLDAFEHAGRAYPAGADAASLCFQHLALVTDDAAAAWGRAKRAGATPISRHGAASLPPSAGAVTAVKFRDPDGHPLEFLHFPDDAAEGWPCHGLLGVDHSAISVSDVAASLRFYAAHGLAPDQGSLNRGPSQVDLDGLDDVEVDVLPMRPRQASPHLELLGYRLPKGRSCGPVASNDVAATRIVWRAGGAGLLTDPDGHWHQLDGG